MSSKLVIVTAADEPFGGWLEGWLGSMLPAQLPINTDLVVIDCGTGALAAHFLNAGKIDGLIGAISFASFASALSFHGLLTLICPAMLLLAATTRRERGLEYAIPAEGLPWVAAFGCQSDSPAACGAQSSRGTLL